MNFCDCDNCKIINNYNNTQTEDNSYLRFEWSDNVVDVPTKGTFLQNNKNIELLIDEVKNRNSNIANGSSEGSLQQGNSSLASGINSFTGGSYNIAEYNNQFIIGKYNKNKNNTIFEIGNGDITNRNNAFEVYLDGHAEIQTQGTNDNSIANKKYVDSVVASQISSVYKPQGSIKDISDLPSLTKEHEGYIYNIEDAFITTDDFIEGAGKNYPSGTNVVIINTSEDIYKYDVLAGIVDLSNYYTKVEVDSSLGHMSDRISDVAFKVYTINTLIPTSASEMNKLTDKKYVDDKIDNIPTVTIDQTYNATSENAQSGKAVASALNGYYTKIDIDQKTESLQNQISDNTSSIDSIGAMLINKQDKLLAGNNITIDDNNKISSEATDRIPKLKGTYRADYPRLIQLKSGVESPNPEGIMGDDAYEYTPVDNSKYNPKIPEGLKDMAGFIVARDTNGNLSTSTPVDDYDCAPKKYVDDKISSIPSSMITDIQIGGNSIVTDSIANIPVLTQPESGISDPGVVRISSLNYGVQIKNVSGTPVLAARSASEWAIQNNRTDETAPVFLSQFDSTLKYAMCDGKGAPWTADEQKGAQTRIGLENYHDATKQDKLIAGTNITISDNNIISAIGGGATVDVQVNSESIVENNIANIPIASTTKLGVIKISSGGIGIIADEGRIYVQKYSPTNTRVQNSSRFVDGSVLDTAVKQAMCDGQGASWTDEERLAALLRLGCTVDDNGFVKWTATT